jgi:hypothetical protein
MLASMVWLVSNVPSEIYRLEIRVENVCSVCSSIMRRFGNAYFKGLEASRE